MHLILASTSPRRKEILNLIEVPFAVIAPTVAERLDPCRTATDETRHWAAEKAWSVAGKNPDATVIGSDTLIDFNGAKIGKPKDHDDALRILRTLSGRAHVVVSSVCVVGPDGKERLGTERVPVRMRNVSDEALARYASSDDPLDKAGAYSAQGVGETLIESIKGDYLAVVGLPLRLLARLLREAGFSFQADIDAIYRNRDFLNWKRFEWTF